MKHVYIIYTAVYRQDKAVNSLVDVVHSGVEMTRRRDVLALNIPVIRLRWSSSHLTLFFSSSIFSLQLAFILQPNTRRQQFPRKQELIAIENRSRVSCAHNRLTSKASIGPNITP